MLLVVTSKSHSSLTVDLLHNVTAEVPDIRQQLDTFVYTTDFIFGFTSSSYLQVQDSDVIHLMKDKTNYLKDGILSRAEFKGDKIVALCDNVLLISESDDGYIRVLDLVTPFVSSICQAGSVMIEPDIETCRLGSPKWIYPMADKGALLIPTEDMIVAVEISTLPQSMFVFVKLYSLFYCQPIIT